MCAFLCVRTKVHFVHFCAFLCASGLSRLEVGGGIALASPDPLGQPAGSTSRGARRERCRLQSLQSPGSLKDAQRRPTHLHRCFLAKSADPNDLVITEASNKAHELGPVPPEPAALPNRNH